MPELSFLRWVRQQQSHHPALEVPIGDDCAVWQWPIEKLVVTTDMLMEGSCFLREAGPQRIGKKAMSVNLSDIAAMAAKPIAAVVSLGIPRDLPEKWVKELFEAMDIQAGVFDVDIIGGDTNSWNGPLVINVTLFGEATSKGVVTRSGAKPGDALFVTGPLGGSILGHHLDFTPRVKEALALHRLVDLHAMIDLSDGLSTDLHHLCERSKCGADVWADRIPLSDVVMEMKDSRTPLEHALHDGEDFELLFAVSPEDAQRLKESPPSGVSLYHVGHCTKEASITLLQDQKTTPLHPQGYEHHFNA
jgi:thiamine-monophosphate kinase